MDPRLALTIASAAAASFALYRLIRTGAHRSFPWFAAYLCATAMQSFVWLAGGPAQRSYILAWTLTMPVLIGLRILIVVELWRKLRACRSGVDHFSRSVVWLVIVFALAVSAASGLDGLKLWGIPVQQTAFSALALALRYSGSALCVICSWVAMFGIAFPQGVPRNLLRHSFLLTGYFAAIAGGFLVMNLRPGSASWVGAAMTGAAAGFYVLWSVLIGGPGERAGEALPSLDHAEPG